MCDKMDGYSMDIELDACEKLRAIFPECFVEGKLDLVKLESLCGEFPTVDENDRERYEFRWKGKADALKLAQQRSLGALRPAKSESREWDTTKNVYIDGDNLEVLKLLQRSYFRKVKMIYIDPPYNTGNDFVYEDDFADSLENYKKVTSQGTTSNPETAGRYHTKWLNMMYPRLRLAKNLLRDDGVIFISIDDNEVHNLRKLCDEIFGEENFRNQITVRRGAKSVQAQFDTWDKLGQDVEHILFYTRDSNYRFPKQTKKLDEKRQGSWNNHWRGTDRPTMRYELFGITPENGQWRWGKERSLLAIENYNKMIAELNVTEDTITSDQIDEYYLSQNEEFDLLRLSKTGKPEHYIAPTDSTLLNTSWQDLLIGSSSEILDLFGTKVFDTAKLTAIIKRMLNFCEKDALILDFFSGSATAAHAVMQLNAEDGGNRRFIMVQLPELLDEKSEAYKAGYRTICDIGKTRIMKAGAKIKSEQDSQIKLGEEEKPPLDVGFRVFKLDTSNLKVWDNSPTSDEEEAFQRMMNMLDVLKPDRSEEDVVYEVLLKLGQELTEDVIPLDINGKTGVYAIHKEVLFMVCLARGVNAEDAEKMAEYMPGRIIFADECFNNSVEKANVYHTLKNHGITIKVL